MLVRDAGMTTFPATTSAHPMIGAAVGVAVGIWVGTAVGTAVGAIVGKPGATVGCVVGKQESERVTVIAVPVYWNVTEVGIVMLVNLGLN